MAPSQPAQAIGSEPALHHLTPPRGAPGLAELSFVEAAGSPGRALHSRSVMIALSHLIEDHAAAAGEGTILIATFQALSRFRRQLARYVAIAPRLGGAYVVGVPDVAVAAAAGVTVVPIEPGWPLVNEWVVLASGPSFCGGLIARDDSGYTPGRPSHQFLGRWTTEPSVVDTCIAAFFRAYGLDIPRITHDSRAILDSSRELLAELQQRLKRRGPGAGA